MTTARLTFTIYQGATFDESLDRVSYPYPIRQECGQIVKECGSPAPDADATPEDYTGCKARMQMRRDVGDPDVILELTTENGGIELVGRRLRICMAAAQTSAFQYGCARPGWESCIGHVEVERPNGDVERQYELAFILSPEVTR